MSGLLFDEEVAGYPASFYFAPTGSGPALTGGDFYGRTLAYTPGQVWLWINGDKVPPPDFTATDGSTITLNNGLTYSNGDTLDIITLYTVNSPNAIAYINQQVLTAAQQKQARANAGVDDRNVLINSDFRINQRTYVTATATAAGVYMHDRWKAGAGGATYTFTQLASSTTITITAGTIIQVVEDKNVEGGGYVLSWTGTAQARAGINSATPSGGYSSSPLLIPGQTAGTTMSVEFNTGTLGKVKLEVGSVPTPFVMPDYVQELNKALRYFQSLLNPVGGAVSNGSTTLFQYGMPLTTQMRASPSVTLNGSIAGTYATAGLTVNSILANNSTPSSLLLNLSCTAVIPSGAPVSLGPNPTTGFVLSAEL